MTDSRAEIRRPAGATERASAWIYSGIWRFIVDWLRAPDRPPTLPSRSGEPVVTFHPAIGFLHWLRFWFWVALIPIDLAIAVGWIVIAVNEFWLGMVLAAPAFILAVVPDVIAYIAIHLRYDTTWYVMSGRSLRIRRGVWIVREMTFTFENVQNVAVHQGPVQRMFGISTVLIETAGGGAATGTEGQKGRALNQGVIEGLANAHEIRDRIMNRVRASRSAGLGDERMDEPIAGPMLTEAHVRVLREIRDLVRAPGATRP